MNSAPLRDNFSVIADLVALISGVVNIVTSLRGFTGHRYANENLNSAVSMFELIVFLLLSLLLIVVAVVGIRSRRKYSISERSLIDSYYVSVREQKNFLNDIEREVNDADVDFTQELLYNRIISYVKELLDNLVALIETLSGQTVNACVKIITGGDFKEIDFNEAFVRTFVRSKNSRSGRDSVDVSRPSGVSLQGNTDFRSIILGDMRNQDDVFYQTDLLKYAKNCTYENETVNWQNYYRATIVVPIRIENNKLFYSKTKIGYYTLGFLCVDSMSNKAFPAQQRRKDLFVKIVKAYSALLFDVMSKYQYYSDKIERSELI